MWSSVFLVLSHPVLKAVYVNPFRLKMRLFFFFKIQCTSRYKGYNVKRCWMGKILLYAGL